MLKCSVKIVAVAAFVFGWAALAQAQQVRQIPLARQQSQTRQAGEWPGRISVKTNALGLGLAIANAGAEVDICSHLSFNFPVSYSAWNYFTPTVKFRTLSVQPELRYWVSEANEGFFAGAHFGCGYYNVATGGEFRTQDHDGKSPALGGGISFGYRLPMSRNDRWKLELSLGAGIYSLNYDRFRNQNNGLLVSTVKKTYIGFDQAAVSVVYSFYLKRNGGK